MVPPDQTFSLSPSEGERVGERGPFARFWWYRQDAPVGKGTADSRSPRKGARTALSARNLFQKQKRADKAVRPFQMIYPAKASITSTQTLLPFTIVATALPLSGQP